jgi:uncharacterized protein (DUF1501 family)
MNRTRRALLAFAAAGAASAALPRAVLAGAPTDRRFVLVLLRGAMDGLGAVVPVGDRLYAQRRGALALDPHRCLALDGFFALNPALAAIHPFWARGELAVVHGAGNGYRTRSHFDAQDLMEAGLGDKTAMSDGWLNRALALMPQSGRRLGLAVGGAVPLVLRGPVQIASWEPPGLKPGQPEFMATLARLYVADPVLGPALGEGLKAQSFSTGVLGEDMKRGPQGFGPNAFKPLAEATGRLLAAAEGPRVAVLEMGGWDTHAGQGTDKGRLFQTLSGLGEGLALLAQAMGPAWRDTVVVAVTEFGRTVAPNGTGGTDHGTASAVLLLGGALKGGRALGDWPGLDRLEENRDLRVATDTRAVLKGLLRDHLGLDAAALDRRVFPDSPARPMMGLIRI